MVIIFSVRDYSAFVFIVLVILIVTVCMSIVFVNQATTGENV